MTYNEWVLKQQKPTYLLLIYVINSLYVLKTFNIGSNCIMDTLGLFEVYRTSS